MKFFLSFLFAVSSIHSFSQKSIHQEQLEFYNSLGNSNAEYYEQITKASVKASTQKATCNLNKVVYGWHPYWVGNVYQNYDWNLLSHFSFFSYEVDASTGNANDTHGWATSAAVNAALASGTTKVTLCVTLFSDHNTFFASSTAQQTLITNLINLIQSRGAHGVNVDFEGLPAAQKTNFANFMVNLATQFHSAIPGSDVSTVLYAVDWGNVFDFSIMGSAVDKFIIMGYDYYWSGSATAGPNDPLYQFGSSYDFNLSKSITYYLNAGCPKNKLILGLPYYGREWPTSSTSIPSSTTANGVSKTYKVVKDNVSGYYSTANHQQEASSFSDIFVFNDGNTKQCFISLEDNFYKRLEHINNTGIAGMGIWALGYDDGYSELWNGIGGYMTDCYSKPCSGTVHDFGGPSKNYYNNENYTWTLAPTGASSIQLSFSSFDVENNYDFLYIYDGQSIASPQITGSPFTGTTIPPVFNLSTGAITFRFTSDNATTKPGFVATYQCFQDTIKPTTTVGSIANPVTNDFIATFTDTDNIGGSGVKHQFYQIADFDGTDWFSNTQNGFFNDEFTNTLPSFWTSFAGTWSVNSGILNQTDQNIGNSNLFTDCNQNNQSKFLYNFKFNISGTAGNRRAGFHFMCDDANQSERGNSYFVWFRQDNSKLQFYEVTNNVFSLTKDVPFSFSASTWYDAKIVYDKSNGKIDVFVNDIFIESWTDSTPLTIGNQISLRSGNCIFQVDDIKVYKSRTGVETVTVGQNPANDIRFEGTPAGKIFSLVIDSVNNISVLDSQLVNVDFPTGLNNEISDGMKIYPNPFSNKVIVEVNNSLINQTIQIKDISGKIVYVEKIRELKSEIPTEFLSTGIYFLEVENSLIKIVKE